MVFVTEGRECCQGKDEEIKNKNTGLLFLCKPLLVKLFVNPL